MSVPDIGRARQFWVETLGLREATGTVLHGPEHEALWGLKVSPARRCCSMPTTFGLRSCEYSEPFGRPWPEDYRISDQGIFNVGLASRDPDTFRQVCDRLARAGYRMEIPSRRSDLEVQYVIDDQGFSVQINRNGEALDEFWGLQPSHVAAECDHRACDGEALTSSRRWNTVFWVECSSPRAGFE